MGTGDSPALLGDVNCCFVQMSNGALYLAYSHRMTQRLARPAMQFYRRQLPHLQRPDKATFVTFNTFRRRPLSPAERHIALDCCTFLHGRKIHLHAAVVMPDHVHLLLSAGRDAQGNLYGLPELLQSIKSVSSHRIQQRRQGTGPVWQRESFDHVLRADEDLRRKAEYICANPVRAGLVQIEDDYRWLWREWIEGAG